MGFYEEIAKYYDYLFPIGKDQVNFIKDTLNNGNTILDVACGSGGYSIELAKLGFKLTAVDLDKKMIELTDHKAKKLNLDIKTKQLDMLNIDSLNQTYDLIFCIGNSIVHLDNLNEISLFLNKAYKLLNKDSQLILQIINFDRIIESKVSSLPTITNKDIDLRFERNYIYDNNNNKILFNTILNVDNLTFKNTIHLLPIKANDLLTLLKENNYTDIELFGDFKQSKFEPLNSFHLIIKAKKI